MDCPVLIATTISRVAHLSKSSGLNFDGIYFTRANAHGDRHRTAADLTVDDKLGAAFTWIEGNLEILPAMGTGDCQEFAHKPTLTYVTNLVNLRPSDRHLRVVVIR